VERQPEGAVRSPEETLREAQRLLDAGMPFHAHEVFEDAWKSGPEAERELWRGLAQLAVGLTHAARGNATGGARLLRRGAAALAAYGDASAHGIGIDALTRWAEELAGRVETGGGRALDAAEEAPRLRREGG
jgi:predicted metal-dependent hydrolase